ncbi:lactonase family protein [Salinactinospora qingdaonensis]|uniref:Lactonase family protein n=2 Tax=Salinactinospora qingdaonensis TaxID=702744 RepID=A0ABP7EW36_9ACTN
MARRLLWIGSYTPDSEPAGDGAGLQRVWLDQQTGELADGGTAAAVSGPSFLASPAHGRLLYAVNEKGAGGLTGFAVDDQAQVRHLATVATDGKSPCHVLVHPEGRHAITANYADGAVSVHPLGVDGAPAAPARLLTHTGSGPNPQRQEGPHAHNVAIAPGGHHLLVADLGTDELRRYTFAPHAVDPVTDAGVAAKLEPGTGPRHIAVHPSGHLFVAGELDSQVHVLRWDETAATATFVTALPATAGDAATNFPSEIALANGGRFLHVANRGADTIATFGVGDDGATLTLLGETPTGGACPRHFARVGDHLVVANQDSGTLNVLTADPAAGGVPRDSGHRLAVPSAACVLPAP